ncbi:MAG: pyruvate kinase [Spirochaetia bacterium]
MSSLRKTKIVCTIGPASEKPEILTKMMKAGMNVARLNFSHGDYNEHQARIDLVRNKSQELKCPISIALDTKGPEIRAGIFKDGKVVLKQGETFVFTPDEIEGTETGCSISHKELYKWVKPGTQILVNDGLIGLTVREVKGQNIVCHIDNGGDLSNKKSVNVPGISIPMPFLSDKDRSDIAFAVKNNLDYVFASFVRNASDVIQLRDYIKELGNTSIQIIAKIENHEGIEDFDNILKQADGVMVARGDLGVEIPLEDVPLQQRMMIKRSKAAGKIVITATQMLESMMKNPRPTRAEASDVANAVFLGTSAVMLSGESAAGNYPIEAVEVMARVAQKAESGIDYWQKFKSKLQSGDFEDTSMAIGHAACDIAASLNAKAILVLTRSGATARAVSRYRPSCPVVARVSCAQVMTQLALVWGVSPILGKEFADAKENLTQAIEQAITDGFLKKGDLIVITGGLPISDVGTTNFLKVHCVGNPVI